MVDQDEMTVKDSHLSNSMDSPCPMSCLLATQSDAPWGWPPPPPRLQAPGSFSDCPQFGMGGGVVAEWSAALQGDEQSLRKLCACWGGLEGLAGQCCDLGSVQERNKPMASTEGSFLC